MLFVRETRKEKIKNVLNEEKQIKSKKVQNTKIRIDNIYFNIFEIILNTIVKVLKLKNKNLPKNMSLQSNTSLLFLKGSCEEKIKNLRNEEKFLEKTNKIEESAK